MKLGWREGDSLKVIITGNAKRLQHEAQSGIDGKQAFLGCSGRSLSYRSLGVFGRDR